MTRGAMEYPVDELFAIAAATGREPRLHLHRSSATGRWVACLDVTPAEGLTVNGAVRALADKLAGRSHLSLCQQQEEEIHG